MKRVKIVTDSTAQLNPSVAKRLGISVVPLNIHLGDETFKEGVDITDEEFLRKLKRSSSPPRISPPSVEDFISVYGRLARKTDGIISIHVSGKLSRTFASASDAAKAFLGRCEIVVVDSLTISLGLGMLATAAAEAAMEGKSIEEIVRQLRGMMPRIYIFLFTDALDYLERGGRIDKAQAILGSMLGIKPFIIIEDGEIIPIEKTLTRSQAIDKLVEFAEEFSNIERLTILQSIPKATKETKLLIERLESVFPKKEFPILVYGPSLASHIGPDAMGLVVYEGVSIP
jgi:DegV family protein with EDD domain